MLENKLHEELLRYKEINNYGKRFINEQAEPTDAPPPPPGDDAGAPPPPGGDVPPAGGDSVSYTHLTLPTNREV